jgi:hypothetical protein
MSRLFITDIIERIMQSTPGKWYSCDSILKMWPEQSEESRPDRAQIKGALSNLRSQDRIERAYDAEGNAQLTWYVYPAKEQPKQVLAPEPIVPSAAPSIDMTEALQTYMGTLLTCVGRIGIALEKQQATLEQLLEVWVKA